MCTFGCNARSLWQECIDRMGLESSSRHRASEAIASQNLQNEKLDGVYLIPGSLTY
jgi:hypothetical protein